MRNSLPTNMITETQKTVQILVNMYNFIWVKHAGILDTRWFSLHPLLHTYVRLGVPHSDMQNKEVINRPGVAGLFYKHRRQ